MIERNISKLLHLSRGETNYILWLRLGAQVSSLMRISIFN